MKRSLQISTMWRIVISLTLLSLIIFIITQRPPTRHPSNRIICGSHLRQIGQAIRMYSDKHNHLLPIDLQSVMKEEDLDPELFICPSSNDKKIDRKAHPNEILDEKSGNCSYRYVYHPAKSFTDLASTDTLVYELFIHHESDGMNVLFGDGHVEWLNQQEGKKVLETIQTTHQSPIIP